MTNALISIKDRIANQLKTIAQTVPAVGGRSISTKGKIFTLPDNTSSPKPLMVIILGWRNFNQYFPGVYNPAKIESAKCFAISQVTHDMAPHSSAPEPQSDSCANCVFNQWGSAPTGRGKACKNQVRLAVITSDAAGLQEPMLLKVSPTGLKSWGMYASSLAMNDQHPIEVVTEISFDANQTYPTLIFKEVEPHLRDVNEFAAAVAKADVLLDTAPISADQ